MTENTSQRVVERKVELHPTPAQVLGPFFVADAPFAHDSVPAGATGDVLRLRGQVLSTDGSAIAGAIAHFWLADTKGVYDNQDARGNVIKISPSKYRNRARVKTNVRGHFRFQCLRPGNYPLEGEAVDVRPGHIHVVVEAPGYKKLVTQLYFQDDAYNETDIPREGFFQPELAIHFNPAMPTTGHVQRGVFNFVLAASK